MTDKQFHDDVDALGALRPTRRAARDRAHRARCATIIEKLVAGGFAYVAEDHVLFSPQAMNAANTVLPRYGALSNRSLDEMIAGARVDVAPYKRDPDRLRALEALQARRAVMAVAGRHQGRGAAGLAHRVLGDGLEASRRSSSTFTAAASISCFRIMRTRSRSPAARFHTPRMANVWMHNGFLQVESEKMSKSLGNFITIRELLADWPGEVLRLNMLKTHYRSPIDWTLKSVEESAKTLDDWYRFAADIRGGEPDGAVIDALADDLNTPQMIAALHGLRNNAARSEIDRGAFAASLRLLGFLGESSEQWESRKRSASGIDASEIEALIAERTAARARKDFKESDRIRDELAAMGIAIKDSKDGTTWEVAR